MVSQNGYLSQFVAYKYLVCMLSENRCLSQLTLPSSRALSLTLALLSEWWLPPAPPRVNWLHLLQPPASPWSCCPWGVRWWPVCSTTAKACSPACDNFSAAACSGVTKTEEPALNLNQTCKIRVSQPCTNTCITLCSINTLPDSPLPPCMYYWCMFDVCFCFVGFSVCFPVPEVVCG